MVTINISERPPLSPAPPFLDRKLVSSPHAGYVFLFIYYLQKHGSDNKRRLVCCVVLSMSRKFRLLACLSVHYFTCCLHAILHKNRYAVIAHVPTTTYVSPCFTNGMRSKIAMPIRQRKSFLYMSSLGISQALKHSSQETENM